MEGRPRPDSRLIGASVLLGLLLSQPGHALGYFAEYGWRSLAMESHGVHAYFPTAIQFSAGLLLTLMLVGGAVAGLGRLAVGRVLGLKADRAPSPIALVLVLVVVQLNAYFLQELTEAQAAGQVTDGAWLRTCLSIGFIGQVPVAIIAGLLIAWCSVRLRAAVTAIRWALAIIRCSPPLAADAGRPLSSPPFWLLEETFPAALRKRGPPPRQPSIAF